MINKIRLHNYLNGSTFSMIEFLIVILLLLPFMAWYFLHGRLLYGIAALGIILNSAVIVAFAANSLIKKEKDLGLRKLFNRKVRIDISNQYPHMQRDTYVLSISILLPFVLCILCGVDLLKRRKNSNQP